MKKLLVPLAALLLAACATTASTTNTVANAAYAAQQTVLVALNTAHNLKVAGTISVATEAKVLTAAEALNTAATQAQTCIANTPTVCTDTAIASALAELTALLPQLATK